MYESWLYTNRLRWVAKNKPKGCLFCRIAKGDKKVPSKILYKDEDVMVIMNLFPYNTGHLEVIPIRHVVNLEELTQEEFSKLFEMMRKCIKLLKKVLKPVGFNIGLNIGNVSGASISHSHIHIVPLFKTDFGFMETIARTKVMPESIDKSYKKLMKEIKILY